MNFSIHRRGVLASIAALAAGPVLAQTAAPFTVRIGYQKSSTLVVVLKTQGLLEKQLAALGAKVSWHEFTSGLPLLEALNLGNVDISADVADTVPVFAQAGIGYLTMNAREFLQTDIVLVGILLYALLGKLADLFARGLERWWLRWHPGYQ